MANKFGKTIKIFLIDGDSNGRMSCELSNWSGKAYKIPRINVKDCSDRPDLTNTGVYLLLGKNETGDDIVYIGEAENILKRLQQHLAQKDFWNEVIIFISKDENLNKAHVKYLESRLYEMTKLANRYSVENSTIPAITTISESDRAEMEEFIENIKMLVNALGHKVFDTKRDEKPKNNKVTFYITANRGADAQGEPTSDGFVVFKGSKAADSEVNSMPLSFTTLRQKLLAQNILAVKAGNFEFTEDYIFSSPSTAAAVVMGRSANGLKEWKTKENKTLGDFEKAVN